MPYVAPQEVEHSFPAPLQFFSVPNSPLPRRKRQGMPSVLTVHPPTTPPAAPPTALLPTPPTVPSPHSEKVAAECAVLPASAGPALEVPAQEQATPDAALGKQFVGRHVIVRSTLKAVARASMWNAAVRKSAEGPPLQGGEGADLS